MDGTTSVVPGALEGTTSVGPGIPRHHQSGALPAAAETTIRPRRILNRVTSRPTPRTLVAAALTAVAVGWVVALWVAPVLASQASRPGAAIAAATIYTAGALVCHQGPARSFHIDGIRVPVCARCAGLYLGAATGLVGWWRLRSTRGAARLLRAPITLLAIVAAPTALSWGAAMAGVWDPGNVVRALAALPLGAVTGAVVSAVVSGELR